MCEVEDAHLELLKKLMELEPTNFYRVYKAVNIPLATAWRKIQQLKQNAFVIEDESGALMSTDKAKIILAVNGDVKSATYLEKKTGVKRDNLVKIFIRICKHIDVAKFILHDIKDIIRGIPITLFLQFKGTELESTAAKLLLYAYPVVEIPSVGEYLIDHGVLVAAKCRLCGGERAELIPTCNLWQQIFQNVENTIFKSRAKRGYG